jgi:enamine deaminase RidA (YjgF/YER057c/UK114 family)
MSDKLQPIFIIGAGRSGTKLLRGLIDASDEVVTVPYDIGYVWRYKNESVPHDELEIKHINLSIKKYIRKTIPKLVKKEISENSRFLLEKSVPNSLRVSFMRAAFPEAKFIHLIRDGRAVVESAIRLWQLPPEKGYLKDKLRYFPLSNYRYAFWYVENLIRGRLLSSRGQKIWGPRYLGMEEDSLSKPLEYVCAKQWGKCVENALDQLSGLDDSQLFTLSYERLVKDKTVLKDISNFIGIKDFSAISQAYDSTISSVNLEKWKERITEDQLNIILNEIESTLTKVGYIK